MTIDLGTGDGRSVLRTARLDPSRLIIGIDAHADGMRVASRKAHKAGLSNAVFVVAAAESLPEELAGTADRVTVTLPWGSLLRGLVLGEGPILAEIAAVCSPGGEVTVLWSLTERDAAQLDGRDVDETCIESAFARSDLAVTQLRTATAQEIVATGSSWAKRLQVGRARPATLLRATRRRSAEER